MKLGKAFGVAVAILFSLKVLEFFLKTSQWTSKSLNSSSPKTCNEENF